MDWERVRSVGVPRGIAEVIADPSFDTKRVAVVAAVGFLAPGDRRRIFALAGSPGTGKSVAAAYAVLEARAAGRAEHCLIDGARVPVSLSGGPLSARWAHARQLFHGKFDAALWAALQRVPLLALDDLGREPRDDAVASLIGALLCERADDGQKTLVTTNLDPATFAHRYSDRVLDRMVGASWHGTVGPSLRRLGGDA